MERTLKDSYTVGVDDVTGCAVIIRNNREVLGKLDRDQSVRFSQDIIDWMPPLMRPVEKNVAIS
jgi:hypothetical protein